MMQPAKQDKTRESSGENQEYSPKRLRTNTGFAVKQPLWQRIILLIVLGYEGAGALSGGSLLAASPDGRIMKMSVEIMHGFFPDFLVPGLILIGFGILYTAAFIAVLRRLQTDWLLSGLALGGLAVWFIVEIIVLQEFHWLHAMWGIPVLVGCLVAVPLVSCRLAARRSLNQF